MRNKLNCKDPAIYYHFTHLNHYNVCTQFHIYQILGTCAILKITANPNGSNHFGWAVEFLGGRIVYSTYH